MSPVLFPFHIDRTGTVEGFRLAVETVAAEASVKGLLALSGDGNGFTPAQVDAVLVAAPKPIFGGIFPGLIIGDEKLERGNLVIGMTQAPALAVVPGLSDPQSMYEWTIQQAWPEVTPGKTMFVFVDGLSRRIRAFISGLFSVFGLEHNFVGGGAGSLSLQQKPCLYTPNGLLADCALLALVDLPSGIGVRHGWQPISGPYTVTEAEHNCIRTLDWQPAFEVYRQAVETQELRFETDNFFEIAKHYPFGLVRLGAEMVVRDPIALLPDGSLRCVGEVPAHSLVHILTGNAQSLIQAAREAYLAAAAGIPCGRSDHLVFFVDCISRTLCLGPDFLGELRAVGEGARASGVPMLGVLTLGEIANNGRKYLEFYNKTAVVAVIQGK